MKMSNSTQRRMALVVGILGLALLSYMVIVEDEPGAVPLGMLLMGAIWRWQLHRREKDAIKG